MKKILGILFILLTVIFVITGCKGKAKLTDKPILTFEFEKMVFNSANPADKPKFEDFAKISFKLYMKDAEKAAKMFLTAIKAGFYNSSLTENTYKKVRYSFNEPDHMYFMKLKFDLIEKNANNVKTWAIEKVGLLNSTWGEELSAASNIKIGKGTLCLNSKNKSHIIIFKTNLSDAGKFVPIGKVTQTSMEAFVKLMNAQTGIGATERTQQGQVVTSNPVNEFIFIKQITVSE